MSYLFLFIGFALLIKGADYFVRGASGLAGLLRISPMMIGLTVVAFGTSSPEAAVSIAAAFKGNADVAIGNVVGSNMFNITLVVGATAWILPMRVENDTVRKEIPFTLLGTMVLLIFISDAFLQQSAANHLSRSDGIVLLLIFVIFMYYVLEAARNQRAAEGAAAPAESSNSPGWGRNIVFTLLGLVGIIAGGQLVVTNATDIALSLGMSQTLVGLTIVALGTSLPELVTSVQAALKGQTDIALGNIVGSNVFNIFFVLGAAAAITPLSVDSRIFLDMWLLIGLTVVLFVFSRTQYRIGRTEGAVLALLYVAYLIFIIMRN